MKVRRRLGRLLRWGLAVGAFAFVVWVVPIRDRCWDPRAPASTALTVTRDAAGCVLHVRTGDVRVDAAECAKLQCEPGVGSTLGRANLGMLLAVLAVYAAGTFAWAARWRLLLGFAGIDMTVLHVWRISTEAQAAGILLPGGIGGDALRIASVLSRPSRPGEERAPAAIAVASVLLDRAIGLSVMSALAAVMGFALGGLPRDRSRTRWRGSPSRSRWAWSSSGERPSIGSAGSCGGVWPASSGRCCTTFAIPARPARSRVRRP